ncbi:MAG: dipeptide epimerase [Rhodobacteraceae bacterium]|nr:dipeptide epimerase [Paracoccaceae bacterium]
MTRLQFRKLLLRKRFPLRISRGEVSESTSLFVGVSDGRHIGWGEMAGGPGDATDSLELGEERLRSFWSPEFDAGFIHELHSRAVDSGVAPSALAALDMALWDLKAKHAGMPLFRLLGLGRADSVTSITVGINPPEVVRERVAFLMSEPDASALKLKLGSEDGIEADKDMFLAVQEALAASRKVPVRVDANGGWTLRDARHMMNWLAERGTQYVEQPLAQGCEDQLASLYRNRPLPMFVDESCCFARDIPPLAEHVDGINLKLMKCGGITEALRMVGTASAFGLQTMIGCMSESSISIAAGAAISQLFDFIDLDSHLNLNPDPAEGLVFEAGRVWPRNVPGHGGKIKDA